MIIPFQHQALAHCESGVSSNLLKHYQLPISEPLAFGIGSGLFFAHLPFVKVNGVPGTTYRIYPGQIFSNLCKRLGVSYKSERFSTITAGTEKLDVNLQQGIPTGCQVSVFYLPFLPEVFRFHFNAHNLIVYGKEGSTYHISDPVMESTNLIEQSDLEKARFAKGYPEPKGRMYYILNAPKPNEIDLESAIKKGIKQTIYFMKSPPLPWFGVNAIDFLSKRIRNYPNKLDSRRATLYLGNIIRMQEEIGTGGAGFRFLYAAFLQEAASILNNPSLKDLSGQMTEIGDQWRDFAYYTARVCKARTADTVGYSELSDKLYEIFLAEKSFYLSLEKAYKS